MNLTPENIAYVKKGFDDLSSKEDLLQLINEVKRFKYGKKSVDISLIQFNYHILPKANKKRYITFSVPKKSGGIRTIHAPNKGLKVLQSCLNTILQCVFQPHKAAYGFVINKSIVDNAALHVGNYYVYNIDLKDFFPSIDQPRVWKCLQNPPFNLSKENEKLILANIISSLCCTEMEVERKNEAGDFEKVIKNVLPQGAPTSPTITNVVCQRLDFLLSAVAKRVGLKYSRYADDITFSSLHNVYQKDSEFLKELHRIVAQERFEIKEAKTRLQKQGYRQEVTGLTVNAKVNVQKHYTNQVRKWLYLWTKYGYDKATSIFLKEYKGDTEKPVKGNITMVNVICGKLDYLKMVKGENDSKYASLAKQFESCKQKEKSQKVSIANLVSEEVDLDEILEVLVNKDLETAMSMFK